MKAASCIIMAMTAFTLTAWAPALPAAMGITLLLAAIGWASAIQRAEGLRLQLQAGWACQGSAAPAAVTVDELAVAAQESILAANRKLHAFLGPCEYEELRELAPTPNDSVWIGRCDSDTPTPATVDLKGGHDGNTITPPGCDALAVTLPATAGDRR